MPILRKYMLTLFIVRNLIPFQEPLMTIHGRNFERSAIMKWMDDGKHYCPVSGSPLQFSSLVLNRTLQWKIDTWMKEHNGEQTCVESASCNYSTPPQRFRCPLSVNLMKDPVSTGEGINYERSVILEWLEVNDNCPVTGCPLTPANIISNENLKREIEEWNCCLASNDAFAGDTTVVKDRHPQLSLYTGHRRSSTLSSSSSSKESSKSLSSMNSSSSGGSSDLTCLSSMLLSLPPTSDQCPNNTTSTFRMPPTHKASSVRIRKGNRSLISSIDNALELSAANIGRCDKQTPYNT